MKRGLFGQYRFGFDPWGLILFLIVLLPTFIWLAVPAPNDVLKTESVTPVADTIASVCQALFVVCMCFLVNKERSKLRFSAMSIASIVCIVVYYIGWVLYYCGNVAPWVILVLTIPPCVAFILFTVDRKICPATVFAAVFAVCHTIFAIMNFIIQ